MGGGEFMRTAARAVGGGGGYRSLPFVNRVLAVGSRGNAMPSTVSSPMGELPHGPAVSLTAPPVHTDSVLPQKSSCEFDNWVVANLSDEEGIQMESLDPPPRLVFGPVPTLEEAKEATSDLKAAIEKIYFPSSASECELSRKYAPTWPNDANRSEVMLNSSMGSAQVVPSASPSVIQAFSMLQQSSEVQDVVASLASDKNVWEAVMKNEKVLEFYKSYQIECRKEDVESSERVFEYLNENRTEDGGNVIVRFISNVKCKLSKLMDDISYLVQDFLGTMSGNPSAAGNEPRDAGSNYLLGGSFVALAVAAILVVLFKRV